MTQIKKAETFVAAFNKKFGNKFEAEPAFLRSDDTVILQEGSVLIINVEGIECDLPIFDYWTEDYKEVLYQLHVLHQVNAWLTSVGWWCEPENAGVLQFLKD